MFYAYMSWVMNDECLKHNEMKATANSNINTSTCFEKVERTSLICDYF